jgi:regulator of replication initiation timing
MSASDNPAETPEVDPQTPAAAEPQSEATPPEPSLMDRARALMLSRPQLSAVNRELTQANEDFAVRVAEVTEENEGLAAENQALLRRVSEFEALVNEAESTARTVTQEATEMVAATGIEIADLPAQESEPQGFEDRFQAAKAAGPTALSKFMTENAAEVKARLSRG